jgi:8-oxo-dGTP pyrophosphatase MutT (NUDIX family)
MSAPQLTEELVREPLRRLLTMRPARPTDGFPGTAAAVLVPLFLHGDDVHVWFVRRPAAMRSHAGQVAFPGGKRDPSDGSLRDTALREAFEEVGILPEKVDLLGPLDAFPTLTGYVIAPFVGWLPADFVPVPSPAEVDRVFSAPLARFVERPSFAPTVITRTGYHVDGELIWGATAAVAGSLGTLIRGLVGLP